MNSITFSFIKSKFTSYYINNDIIFPKELSKREFGFANLSMKPSIYRHISFKNKEEIKSYLLQRPPLDAFYGCAYYNVPNAPVMKEKEWLGADLIFDLDGDYLSQTMKYNEMLYNIKCETQKLLYELLDTFAIDRKNIELVFSGNRGYHIHVYDKSFIEWKQYERRELVNYLITKCDIDPPVSYDIVRLIRIPNSLHGKTGMVAEMIPLDKFDKWEPHIMASSNTIKTTIGYLTEWDAIFRILKQKNIEILQ